ncbi:MAG: acylneuraminate cytidylyltransferase family protein [Pyrinomonadaceae bacterium]
MRVLGLITARGGSKGVPRKNIRLLEGKPLLAYTAEAGRKANKLSRLVLSTEDEEIAEVGRKCGIEVPFVRPPELAADTTPTLPVIQHAIRELEKAGENFDAVCLLQPTNPLRRSEDIDNCIELLVSSGADSVISVLPVPHEYNPHWVYWQNGDEGTVRLVTGETEPVSRRQDLPSAWHRDGSVYVTRTCVVVEENSLYGSKVRAYEMDPLYSANIDTEDDWESVRKILAEK